MLARRELDAIPVHFIFCTERTGSSLLTAMLNMHPSILVASEEPFALYFQSKYRNKSTWSTQDIEVFTNSFCRLFEKNFELYYDSKEALAEAMAKHASDLTYERLIKLCYLNFYDSKIKVKDNVKVLVDKQMKLVFHPKFLTRTFPNAKVLILSRDVIGNVKAKRRRRIDFLSHPYYLAHLWLNTYKRCLEFPNSMLVSFEALIDNPSVVLDKINQYYGVEYDPNQLNYSAGFEALLLSRKDRLSQEYVALLLDFHRGLLQKPIKGQEIQLSETHEKTILTKTVKIRIALGYTPKDIKYKVKFGNELIWRFYGLLAYLGRTWLWRTYARIPLGIKLWLRRKKESV